MAKLLTQWPFVNSSLVNELKRLKFFPHTWNPQILTILFPFWLQVLEKWFLDGMPGFLVTIFTLNLRSHPFKMICSKYIFIMCHVGMRVGSKRKVTIPPALGWVHYSPPSSISLVHVTICEHLLENINCLLFFQPWEPSSRNDTTKLMACLWIWAKESEANQKGVSGL